jgi:hypothetical protein
VRNGVRVRAHSGVLRIGSIWPLWSALPAVKREAEEGLGPGRVAVKSEVTSPSSPPWRNNFNILGKRQRTELFADLAAPA